MDGGEVMAAQDQAHRNEIVRRHLEGKSYNQIARALGITRGTVGGHLARWRLESNDKPASKPFSAVEDRVLLRRYRRGDSMGVICNDLGRFASEVEVRISELKMSDRLIDDRADREFRPDVHVVQSQREADRMFVRAIAQSMMRGEHLPGVGV